MPYNVSTADVEARWRALSTAEDEIAQTILGDLVNDLDLRRPTLSSFLTTLAASTVPGDAGKAVALERVIVRTLAWATKRALRNPDTLRSFTIQAAGGIGVGYDNAAAALAATAARLTREDLAGIDQATNAVGGTAPGAAGSVGFQAYPERYADPDLTVLPTP